MDKEKPRTGTSGAGCLANCFTIAITEIVTCESCFPSPARSDYHSLRGVRTASWGSEQTARTEANPEPGTILYIFQAHTDAADGALCTGNVNGNFLSILVTIARARQPVSEPIRFARERGLGINTTPYLESECHSNTHTSGD